PRAQYVFAQLFELRGEVRAELGVALRTFRLNCIEQVAQAAIHVKTDGLLLVALPSLPGILGMFATANATVGLEDACYKPIRHIRRKNVFLLHPREDASCCRQCAEQKRNSPRGTDRTRGFSLGAVVIL